MENLNLLFYKTFYSKLGKADFETDLKAKAERMVKSKFYSDNYEKNEIANQTFLMKTLYPGLLVGTGYAHGVDNKEDIKIGFSFDYVTGLPYIPGSSVKGLLRSCFEQPGVVESLLGNRIPDGEDTKEFVRLLKLDIFENGDTPSDKTDIFFDAVIKHGNTMGYVLGFDYITPHGDDLTKNPTPIQFLKILPDVVLEFAFKLNDSFINGEKISAGVKKHLFISLLSCFGIGAKTNVGYGILTNVTDDTGYVYPERSAATEIHRSNSPVGMTRKVIETANKTGKLEVGKFYDCTINNIVYFGVFVWIDGIPGKSALIRNSELPKEIAQNVSTHLKNGGKIIAKLIAIKPDGKLNMSFESKK